MMFNLLCDCSYFSRIIQPSKVSPYSTSREYILNVFMDERIFKDNIVLKDNLKFPYCLDDIYREFSK
jgi:hypothetical protein